MNMWLPDCLASAGLSPRLVTNLATTVWSSVSLLEVTAGTGSRDVPAMPMNKRRPLTENAR